jgi:pantoate--beta-alanine ligase
VAFELIETIAALRAALARRSAEREGARRRLVPTMGALHAGHVELIKRARRDNGVVVVSIFVNPLQFNNRDDLARYPRTLESDVALCRELGVDIVFAPSVAEVYPQPLECSVDVGRLADHLCGKFRPGHFRGVATVVLKLFEMVQPDVAYFGEKDAQQLAIIKRLAADFNLPVAVIEVPTVREADGLALSSRNRHLSADERALAPSLYHALVEAKEQIARGRRRADEIRATATARIPQDPRLRLEYFEMVDPATLQPVPEVAEPVRIAGAMWVGNTRLIDNLLVSPAGTLRT